MSKLLALLLISNTAIAAPFLDLGLGYALESDVTKGKSCILDWKKDTNQWGCSSNPLGYAAIGYEKNNFSIQYEHWSSIPEYDAGMDIISIKYRIKP